MLIKQIIKFDRMDFGPLAVRVLLQLPYFRDKKKHKENHGVDYYLLLRY